MNDTLLRVIRGEPTTRLPVWFLRQAGRYLPEYHTVRKKAGSFMSLCRHPAYAVEVALQPLRRFDLDATIVFSDILMLPDAMGVGIYFDEAGPHCERPVRTPADVSALSVCDGRLPFLFETVGLLKSQVEVPVIGFAGSPFTLATYMIEGGTTGECRRTFDFLYRYPDAFGRLMDHNSQAVLYSLLGQAAAGADVVMLFDSSAGAFPVHLWREYSMLSMRAVISAFHEQYPEHPVIVFVKGGSAWLQDIMCLGCQVISLDWSADMASSALCAGGEVALQGNLDPRLLLTNPTAIQTETRRLLEVMSHYPRFIMNLGHGVHRETPPAHIEALLSVVRDYPVV